MIMCGIFGIINIDKRPVDQTELYAGIKLLDHRGPDGHGQYIDRHLGLSACRLKIMDQDDLANQPFTWNQYVLLFNGCIYNYAEVRAELIQQGYSFDTTSDTEVVIKAYDYWGKSCLSKFNGMWAIVIYDSFNKDIFLSRDRYGIKPLYYYQSLSQFAFASEIKAFTALTSWEAIANHITISAYLAYGMQDYSAETMFENVKQLPAGSYASINTRDHRLDIHSYYQIGDGATREDLNEQDAINQFQYLFHDSIKLRHGTAYDLGYCLSGGLDSSSILCESLSDSADFGKSISVIYNQPEIDESRYVKEVIDQYPTDHYQISPSLKNLIQKLPSLIWTQDEPFSSASVYAQHELYGKAQDLSLKVMLDGQGADEILGGYDIFYLSQIRHAMRQNPLKLISTISHLFGQYNNSYANAWKRYKQYRTKKKQVGHAWLKMQVDFPIRAQEKSIRDTSQYLMSEMGLPVLLHYADRNSMAHSIESRLPFLDYRLVEFCLNLKDSMKINKGIRKWILRESMKEKLPHLIYERKNKLGFETPQKQWMKDHEAALNLLKIEAVNDLTAIVNRKATLSMSNPEITWRLISLSIWKNRFGVKDL